MQIPEGEVDGADGIGGQSGRAVGLGQAEHHVGETLDGVALLADQPRRQVIVDNGGDRPAMRGVAEAPAAVLGRYLAPDAFPRRQPLPAMCLESGIARHGIGDLGVFGSGRTPRRRRGFVARSDEAHRLDIGDLHARLLVREYCI
ncbi:MAG TPA: hypothetical protein VEZ12_19560 [Herpetosiphonaceae bacterium]|nr:hypothetical protein [Herpetosiphonaceae bacterium]